MPDLFSLLIAPLLGVSILSLSWWSADRWRASHHPFYLCQSGIGVLAAVIVPLSILHLPLSWIIGLVGLLAIDTYLLGPGLTHLSPPIRPWLRTYNIIASVVIAAGILSSFIWDQYRPAHTSIKAAQGITQQLEERSVQLLGAVKSVAPQVTTTIDRSSLLQDQLIANKLDFLNYIDAQGILQSRAEQPSRTGSNFWQMFPWLESHTSGESRHGLAHLEDGRLALLASTSLTNGGELVGGQYTTAERLQALAPGINWALTDHAGTVAAHSTLNIWQSADLDRLLQQDLSLSTHYDATVRFPNHPLFLATSPVSTLDHTLVELVTLQNE